MKSSIGKLPLIVVSVAICVMLVAGVMTPIISENSVDYETHTNEGAEWLKLAYRTDKADFTTEFSVSSTITVTGDGTQTGESKNLILYADANNGIFIDDGKTVLLMDNGTVKESVILSDTFTVSRTGGTVSVTNGTDVYDLGNPSYCYVPSETGKYGTFSEGVETDRATVAVGGFADVYVMNDKMNYDLPLSQQKTEEDGVLKSVRWVLKEGYYEDLTNESESESESAPLLSATPPLASYYDGYYGFNLDNGIATVISYSGPTGADVEITIPASVTHDEVTYPVKAVGIGIQGQPVVETTAMAKALTISEGIETINPYAFAECGNIVGDLNLPHSVKDLKTYCFWRCVGFTNFLTIPDGVLHIEKSAFSGCTGFTGVHINNCITLGENSFLSCYNMTGDLIIPEHTTSLGTNAFKDCSGFTGVLILPHSLTEILGSAFNGCTGLTGLVNLSNATPKSTTFTNTTNIKEVLNLSSTEYTTTSYALNADEVRDNIEATAYLCAIEYEEPVPKEGVIYTLLSIIPLLMIVSIVAGIGMMIYRR